MTRKEARKLAIGDPVFFGDDPTDTGVVVNVTETTVAIRWNRPNGTSREHRLNELRNVHRAAPALKKASEDLAAIQRRRRNETED